MTAPFHPPVQLCGAVLVQGGEGMTQVSEVKFWRDFGLFLFFNCNYFGCLACNKAVK